MRRRALILFGFAIAAGAASSAIAAPGQGMQPQRGDVRDLSPLPQRPRSDYPANELSNDGIFAPAPEASTVITASKRAHTTGNNVTALVASDKSELDRAIDRTDIYYNSFFNGPSLDGARETTWNPWNNGPDAFYIYHSLDFDYHFDRSHLVGFELSGKQTLVTRTSPYGIVEQPSFQINDPQFWYKRSGLINFDAFTLDTRLSLWPAMTDYSVNSMGQVASAALDMIWNLKVLGRSWTTNFTTRARPTLYTDIYRPDGLMREWMYLSVGSYLGYSLSQSWQVNFTTTFDCMFYAQNDQFLARNDSSADRAQLELNYNLGRLARIGGYVQAGIIEPAASKMNVGFDVTVNFL